MILLTSLLQQLSEWDASLLLWINGMHNAFFDQAMFTYSGRLVWIPMYAAILYVMARNFSWRTTLFCVVAMALTITFADQVCSSLLRPFFTRMRPSNLENPLSAMVHIVNDYRGGAYGFPSCHAANTFGLAFFLHFLFRKRWLTAFMMVWALITCYSRSYLGVHYPGDLLVGSGVGTLGAYLMYRLFVWTSGYQRQQQLTHLYMPVWAGLLTIVGILIYATCASVGA